MQTPSQSRFFFDQFTVARSSRWDFQPVGSSLRRSAPIPPRARRTTAWEEILSWRSSSAFNSPLLTLAQSGIAFDTATQYSTAMLASLSGATSPSVSTWALSNSLLASYRAARLHSLFDRTGRDTASLSTMPLKTGTCSTLSTVTCDSTSRLSYRISSHFEGLLSKRLRSEDIFWTRSRLSYGNMSTD